VIQRILVNMGGVLKTAYSSLRLVCQQLSLTKHRPKTKAERRFIHKRAKAQKRADTRKRLVEKRRRNKKCVRMREHNRR